MEANGDLAVIKAEIAKVKQSYLENLASAPLDGIHVLQGKAQAMSHVLNILTPKETD